jgi:hypothetical protein
MTNAVTNDIRDIKPPLEIPNGWAWLWWTLGTVAALAILFLVFRWWQKQRAQISIAPPIPAHVRAKQKLEEALALISQPKEFCVLVSDTVRFYLEERFDFRAPLPPDFVAVAAAVAGVAERQARRAAGVRLFVGATGAGLMQNTPFARGRISGGIALAHAGGFHFCARAAASVEKHDGSEGQRH